ncbi:MAG: O-antigen ligase family protein [Sulfurovum sp.]|nr:O-antigen ligase family protein [Sulfurovum sp.]
MQEKTLGAQKGVKLEKSIEYLTYFMILLFYTGKVFQIFTVLIDILFITLLYIRKDRMFFIKHKKLLIGFTVFFAYLVIQSMFAHDVGAALGNAIGMIRFVILFFALWYIFNTAEKIRKLMYSVITIIVVLFIDSAYQYVKGVDLFGHPLFQNLRLTAWDTKAKLGSFVAVLSGAAVASLFIIKQKWISLVAILMLVLMVFFSGSKGPVVYLVGSVVTVLLFSKAYRKYVLPILLLFSLVLGTVVLTNEKIAKRFEQFKHPLSAQNTSSRNQIYAASVEMLKSHPLLGIGSRNYREVFPSYYQPIYEQKQVKTYSDKKYINNPPLHTHSMLLSFLLNWGVLGTLLFFYILYMIYKEYIRGNEVALLTSIGLFYCIAPFNFGNTIARSQWQFYIFLTLAFVVIFGSYKRLQETEKECHEIS